MKKRWIVFLLSVSFLFVTACNASQEPKITIEAVVSHLSDEEFEDVGTNGLDNPAKDDFRKFTFDFEVEHSSQVKRKVDFPKDISWREAVNTIDHNKNRYWSGNSLEQNNERENFADYEFEFIFYSKGLNEEVIKTAFNSIVFELYLDPEKGESIKNEYKVSDVIKFDSN